MIRQLSIALLVAGCGGTDSAARTEPEPVAASEAMCEAGGEASAEGEASACIGLPTDEGGPPGAENILGEPLASCSTDPVTGFRRTGACETGPSDRGVHVVCAEMTQAFLEYSKSRGNDLITPLPAYGFPGLEPGDKWCLCASRWQEAVDAEVAPPVDLAATNARALDFMGAHVLRAHAL